MRGIFVTAVVVLGLTAGGVFQAESPASTNPLPPTPTPYGIGRPGCVPLSSASCAAAACHGGGQVGRKGSEHSTWAPDLLAEGPTDPHAKAYRVLFNADSVRIAKTLGIPAAHKEALCLKCHAVEGVQPEPAVSEGVGCAACHGPAEKWLSAHVEPGWKGLSNRAKWEKYGFVPAGNLVARSLNCAGCHVGGPDREVNHDLIAAGHPRLAFEAARFHFHPNYRQHWVEKTPQPDFEVRAWVIGQAAVLRTATDLLRARAERAASGDPATPWPEFSGLSCYACHQKIGEGGLNRDAGAGPRPLGVPGWEVWSNAGAEVAAAGSGRVFPGVPGPELRELAALRKLMQKRDPNPKAVAERAARALTELDGWLAALQVAEDCGTLPRLAPDTPRKFAHALAANALSADGLKLADHDWDALSANYLGCAAMYHAAGGQSAMPGWTAPLRSLGAELRFPPVRPGERFDSPATFGVKERMRVRDQFRALLEATTSPEDRR